MAFNHAEFYIGLINCVVADIVAVSFLISEISTPEKNQSK